MAQRIALAASAAVQIQQVFGIELLELGRIVERQGFLAQLLDRRIEMVRWFAPKMFLAQRGDGRGRPLLGQHMGEIAAQDEIVVRIGPAGVIEDAERVGAPPQPREA